MSKRFPMCAGPFGLALVILLARPAAAAWPTDPLVNVPLCTATNVQVFPRIVTDGAGGAIVTWADNRVGFDTDIYAQHVLADGAVDLNWPHDGRAVCAAMNYQRFPQPIWFGAGDVVTTIVADGAGGAIITWEDNRSGTNLDIYAQHVRANGTVDPNWPPDGRALCTALDNQSSATIVADGTGGGIVTWEDRRNGTDLDIYAQHVQAGGAVDPDWPPDGRALCTAMGDQEIPTVVADGLGGAIVTWEDSRSGTNLDIYAQHVRANGTVDPNWPPDGRALCTDPFGQGRPGIIADGSGGAVVAWQDNRSGGTSSDIFAQHVLAGGTVDPDWPLDGRALCTTTHSQGNSTIASDGVGGAIVAWQDRRTGTLYHIYAQHVKAGGGVDAGWPPDGRALCAAPGGQGNCTIVADGGGGAIVTWEDARDPSIGHRDIYAQHVLASGAVDPNWPPDGRAICAAMGPQDFPTIIADCAGGAMITWHDTRNDPDFTETDIYVQRVLANGQLGGDACVGHCATPPLGLVAWWPLDEAVGKSAVDLAGSNHGLHVGSPVPVSGKVSGALDFPTAGDYVEAPDNPTLDFDQGPLSIDAWVQVRDSTTTSTIVDKREGTSQDPRGYVLFVYNGRLGFQLADGQPFLNHVSADPNLIDGQWHHVAVTVDRTATDGGKLWVDATLVHTFNPQTRPGSISNGGPLRIGQREILGPLAFDGLIDEVEVFGRVLDPTEIQAMSLAGALGKCKPDSVGSITGMKYEDLNGDGAWESGEPGLENWTIELRQGNTVVRIAKTDAAGRYQFLYVPFGNYTLDEVQQLNWAQTAPAGGSYSFFLDIGGNIAQRDFGNYALVATPPLTPTGRVQLVAPWPNPVSTDLAYFVELPRAGHASVDVLDVSGRIVRQLVNQDLQAGRHAFHWDPRGKDSATGSGMYVLRLRFENIVQSRKFVLVK